jgi:hypothetical protein
MDVEYLESFGYETKNDASEEEGEIPRLHESLPWFMKTGIDAILRTIDTDDNLDNIVQNAKELEIARADSERRRTEKEEMDSARERILRDIADIENRSASPVHGEEPKVLYHRLIISGRAEPFDGTKTSMKSIYETRRRFGIPVQTTNFHGNLEVGYMRRMMDLPSPSKKWKESPNRRGLLDSLDGFVDAMKRMDLYMKAWTSGRGAESGFDEKGSEPSVVSEDFVATNEILNEDAVAQILSRQSNSAKYLDVSAPNSASEEERTSYVSNNITKWKMMTNLKMDIGAEFYEWVRMLIQDYGMIVELRLIDFEEYVREHIRNQERQDEAEESSNSSDSNRRHVPSSRQTHRLVRGDWENEEKIRKSIRKRKNRKSKRGQSANSDSEGGGPPSKTMEGETPIGREQALMRLKELIRGPIPYARIIIHHSMFSNLRYYQLSGSVRITANGVRNPNVSQRTKDPMFGRESWGETIWNSITTGSGSMERLAFYQDPKDVKKTYEEIQRERVRGMLARDQTYWRSQTSVPLYNPLRKHKRNIPCGLMTQLDVGTSHVLKVPVQSPKATICMQVELSLRIPWRDGMGNIHVLDVSFSNDTIETNIDKSVGNVTDPDKESRPKNRKKQTPFNCNDPFCDGVIDNVPKCMDIPLDKITWIDDSRNVKMDVHSSVLHRLIFPFVWGDSYVKLDMHVENPLIGDNSNSSRSDIHRALASEMDECGDFLKYVHISNVSFVCAVDVLQLALSELLEYERRNDSRPEFEEILRSASIFMKRGK